MSDNQSPEQRHHTMAAIHSSSTKPEVRLRHELWRRGFRYRKNDPKLPGKPDIVLPKYRTVIFVNGCFWHHHDCKYFVWPKNNAEFWRKKITTNKERDQRKIIELEKQGWRVLLVWECELKESRELTLETLVDNIRMEIQTDLINQMCIRNKQ